MYLKDFIWVDTSVANIVWVITLKIERRVLVFEKGELLFGGQFAVDEEESNLEEGRMFCKLLDGYAPVLQDPLISIDVADP